MRYRETTPSPSVPIWDDFYNETQREAANLGIDHDVYRHTYGAALLTRQFGALPTRVGGWLHEYFGKDNKPPMEGQDVFNNEVGIAIGRDAGTLLRQGAFGELHDPTSYLRRDEYIKARAINAIRSGISLTRPADLLKTDADLSRWKDEVARFRDNRAADGTGWQFPAGSLIQQEHIAQLPRILRERNGYYNPGGVDNDYGRDQPMGLLAPAPQPRPLPLRGPLAPDPEPEPRGLLDLIGKRKR